MAYKLYHKQADYSYCLGAFPSFECLKWRPDLVEAIFYHPDFNDIDHLFAVTAEQNLVKPQAAPELLAKLSGRNRKPAYLGVIWQKAKLERPLKQASSFHLVLHEISDSGNLGTILRTALAFGIYDIALVGQTVSPYLPEVGKASMGALFALRLQSFSSLDEYVARFKERRFLSFCLSETAQAWQAKLASIQAEFTTEFQAASDLKNQSGQQLSQMRDKNLAAPRASVKTASLPQSFSLVFGNEGRGLPPICEKAPFEPVFLEQGKEVDSLNLAIAAGLGIYGITRIYSN